MPPHDLPARFLAAKSAQGRAPATVDAYAWALAYLPAQLPAAPEPLEDILAAAQLAPESKRDLHRRWRTFFRWAARRYGVPDAAAAIDPPPPAKRFPRTFTEPEISALWHSCADPTDRGLVAIALGCGLRLGEIAGLTWSDVSAGHIRVTGKTGPRALPLPPDVQRHLVGLGDVHTIWIGARGPLGRTGIKQRFERIARRAAIRPPKAGPHTYRHTFASMWIRDRGDVFHLQRLLGHSSVETTMLYVHMNGEDLADAMARHSPAALLELA